MTPFKERMNLYRAYRELNPDKNYWDWKASIDNAGKLAQQFRTRTNKPNFVQRLEDPNRQTIPSWEDDTSVATHRLSYATYDDGSAVIYPEVQQIGNELYDFTDPTNRQTRRDAYQSALNRGDVVWVPTEQDAVDFTTQYKNHYPTFSKGSPEVPAMQDGGVSDYITQLILAVREKAYQNSLNRTMPRVPTITGKIVEVFEYDGTTTDALIQQLNNISYQIGLATGLNLIDLQNKEAAILSQLDRVMNSENGLVVNTVYATTNGPSCIYTATDNYGEQYLQPSTNVFMELVGRNGFRQIPIDNVKKGDIVIYAPNKGLNHGMIFDGYDEQGNKLYNYSDGGSDSNAIKKHAKYPTTDDMLRAYEFVGTTKDSARWINEYEKLQNVVPSYAKGGNTLDYVGKLTDQQALWEATNPPFVKITPVLFLEYKGSQYAESEQFKKYYEQLKKLQEQQAQLKELDPIKYNQLQYEMARRNSPSSEIVRYMDADGKYRSAVNMPSSEDPLYDLLPGTGDLAEILTIADAVKNKDYAQLALLPLAALPGNVINAIKKGKSTKKGLTFAKALDAMPINNPDLADLPPKMVYVDATKAPTVRNFIDYEAWLDSAPEREMRDFLKHVFNKWTRHYGYEPVPLDLSVDAAKAEMKKRILQHNSFLRGVRDPDIEMNHQFVNYKQRINAARNKKTLDALAKRYNLPEGRESRELLSAKTYAGKTGHGRAGMKVSSGMLYTSNSLGTGAGYASINGDPVGSVFSVLRLVNFPEDYRDWLLYGDFPLRKQQTGDVLLDRYVVEDLPYLLKTGRSLQQDLVKRMPISFEERAKRFNLIATRYEFDNIGKLNSEYKRLLQSVDNDYAKIIPGETPFYKRSMGKSQNELVTEDQLARYSALKLLSRDLTTRIKYDLPVTKAELASQYFRNLNYKPKYQQIIRSSKRHSMHYRKHEFYEGSLGNLREQLLRDAGVDVAEHVKRLQDEPVIFTTERSRKPIKKSNNAYNHYVFVGNPGDIAVDNVKLLDYSDWLGLNASRQHRGTSTPGYTRKFEAGGVVGYFTGGYVGDDTFLQQYGGDPKSFRNPMLEPMTLPDGSTINVVKGEKGLLNTPIADMFNPMNDVYDIIQVGKDAMESNWAGVGTGLALSMVPNAIEKPLRGVIKRIGNRLRTHSPYAKSVDNYDKKVQEFFVNDVAPRMRNNDKLIDDYVNNVDNFKYDVVDASEFDENVAGKFVPSRGVIEMNEAFNNRPDFQYILGHEQRHDLSNTISITPELRKLLKQAYVVPDTPFTDRSHLWKEMEATNTQIRLILYEQLLREGEDVTVDMLNRYIDMIDDSTLADLLLNVNVYGQDYSKSLYKNGKLDKTAMLNFRNALKYVPAVVPAIVTPWMMSNIEDKSN